MAAHPPSSTTSVLLVAGYCDGPIFGTTFHVWRALQRWKRKNDLSDLHLLTAYFALSSALGRGLDGMSSRLQKRLQCSPDTPHGGIVYASSMGALLVKRGMIDGWLDPSAVVFVIGPHLGIEWGWLYRALYWPSDWIRTRIMGKDPSAVRRMASTKFTAELDRQFEEWLRDHPSTRVLFVGHEGDGLVPIASSVPETYLNHPLVEHKIFEKGGLNLAVHQTFPFSSKCLVVIKAFIRSSAMALAPKSLTPLL